MNIAATLKLLVSSRWSQYTFLFVLLATCYLLLVTKPAHAQCTATPVNAQEAINAFNRCAIQSDIFDDKIFNFNQLAGTSDSLNTLLFGTSSLHPETNALTHGTGALASSGRLVATLYNPPISGVNYLAQEIQNFNPIKPAYAQQSGIGFGTLSPIQGLWRMFRNLAYAGFVIVFVIIGFMIMFRAHISPQAVATVQDAIPRIVVAMILVTFSYAIAGLMVDFMFLMISMAISIVTQSTHLNPAAAGRIFEDSIIKIIAHSWGNLVSSAAGSISLILEESILNDMPEYIGALVGWFGGGIGGLIVGIAVLFIMFRIFFMLLMAYVSIVVLTIISPLFFLLQSLPGQNGAKEWFKQMASNIVVFPAVATMLLFAAFLSGIDYLGGCDPIGGCGGPLGGIDRFPLLAGGINAAALGNVLAIGFLLATPEFANLIKKSFGTAGQGGGIGGAAMAGFGAGAGAARAGAAWGWGGKYNPIADRRREGQETKQIIKQENIRRRVNREQDERERNEGQQV